MLPLINHIDLSLPLEDPILKFLLIMTIVLAAPLVLNKFKIPHLLGLIIAGAVIGPHGLNLVLRDSSIIMSGTAGLLYIMFLSGLEMDMNDFRRNSWRSLVFGLYTFSVPMCFGIFAGYFILEFSIHTSILLAGLFASQTLIAYPIISKLGITRDKAVTIAVGGTIITDMLALLVLTVVVGQVTGQTDQMFWYRLAISISLFVAFVLLLFPIIGRWFFKRCSDSVSQYVFVLVMLFLAAFGAHLAGMEPIIGAFLGGLAMNRLIPRTSPLMNRIEFVGNAIFIPFFLIGVGMLIDYRAFFKDWNTLKVSAVMIVLVTAAKYIAALLTQKTFNLSRDQRTLLFGLSSAHVAATLAAVMVGYNVILGYTPDGEPIRLLGESVLNGTILMILATCTIATITAQRGAHNIALHGSSHDEEQSPSGEHVLVPVSNDQNVNELVGFGVALTTGKRRSLYALNAVDNKVEDHEVQKQAEKILDTAAAAAASTDIHLHRLLRYDVNIINAIVSVVLERNITDIVMGMHLGRTLGKTIPDIITQSNTTTFIYRPSQPLGTLKRHIVVVPREAEKEVGFQHWLQRIQTMGRNTGAKLLFHAPEATMPYLHKRGKSASNTEYITWDDWDNLPDLLAQLRENDALWLVMSRRGRLSYQPAMARVHGMLVEHLGANNFVLVFPVQAGDTENRYL